MDDKDFLGNIENDVNYLKKNQKFNLSKIYHVRTFLEKSDQPLYLATLTDGRIAYCADLLIKVYNPKENAINLSIKGHKGKVLYISSSDTNVLFSSSSDKTVKIWKITSNFYTCLMTITGHSHCVNQVIRMSNSRLATLSWYKAITIWKNTNHISCKKLKKITDSSWVITSILELSSKDFLISGSGRGDETLRFWNTKTFDCAHYIKNIDCCSPNSLIEFEKTKKLLVGGLGVVGVIDLKAKQEEMKIRMRTSCGVFSFVQVNRDFVICGCGDMESNGIMYYLNLINCQGINEKSGLHKGGIISMKIIERFLFSAGWDGFVKVWSF